VRPSSDVSSRGAVESTGDLAKDGKAYRHVPGESTPSRLPFAEGRLPIFGLVNVDRDLRWIEWIAIDR
jgi:hypothetical protein